MKILIIGSTGQLGWELQRAAAALGDITAVDYPEIDLAKPDSIKYWVEDSQPDLILNAAAYTAVDQAENDLEIAQAINGKAPGILAEAARERGALLIHYSTDFVFDGEKGTPYNEADLPNPINAYGRSKLAGERAIQEVGGAYFIFRTSWLYSTRKECFLTKVLQWARSQETVKIVTDQIGSPTWARSLAVSTVKAVEMMNEGGRTWTDSKVGIYHIAGNGSASRFEWAQTILSLDPHPEEQTLVRLVGVRSTEFVTSAQRPANSSLDCSRFQDTFRAFYNLWGDDLKLALTDPIS